MEQPLEEEALLQEEVVQVEIIEPLAHQIDLIGLLLQIQEVRLDHLHQEVHLVLLQVEEHLVEDHHLVEEEIKK